jgi:hypothetical protein
MGLEHDPEKYAAVFRKIMLKQNLERDNDSTKSIAL